MKQGKLWLVEMNLMAVLIKVFEVGICADMETKTTESGGCCGGTSIQTTHSHIWGKYGNSNRETWGPQEVEDKHGE